MATEHRPHGPTDVNRQALTGHRPAQAQESVHPAFPAQALPWQPASTRSPRTHLVPPELLR